MLPSSSRIRSFVDCDVCGVGCWGGCCCRRVRLRVRRIDVAVRFGGWEMLGVLLLLLLLLLLAPISFRYMAATVPAKYVSSQLYHSNHSTPRTVPISIRSDRSTTGKWNDERKEWSWYRPDDAEDNSQVKGGQFRSGQATFRSGKVSSNSGHYQQQVTIELSTGRFYIAAVSLDGQWR